MDRFFVDYCQLVCFLNRMYVQIIPSSVKVVE